MCLLARFVWIVLLLSPLLPVVHAQAPRSLNVRVADLEQDLGLVLGELRQLRLEVESLRRENVQLRETLVTQAQLRTALQSLQQELQRGSAQQRQQIIDQVAREVEALAQKTEAALKAMAQVAPAAPRLEAPVTFNDQFPKTGVSYTVQSGDTLGAIAREHDSRVTWIRNANKLIDDLIHPGQELFLPQND